MVQIAEQFLDQLLPRHNHVASLELLAVVMMQWIFRALLEDTNWLVFIDSECVRQAICNGTMRKAGQDCNLVIGRMWIELCRIRTAFWSYRVESAANPADSPSRNDLSVFDGLRAKERVASMPPWLDELWRP